jgi:prepilin-type N-terminal cleavage/methylation domain-containing protein
MARRASVPRRPETPPRRRRPRRDAGFTIVEVIVAMVILTAGVVALAGATALMVRQVTLAEVATARAAAFQSVIERLRALDWEDVGSGSTTEGRYAVSWSIAEDLPQSRVMRIVTVGPGFSTSPGYPSLRPSIADTFTYRLLRR